MKVDWIIRPYGDEDFSAVMSYVSAIQEHERDRCPQLKTGLEISEDYAKQVLANVKANDGICLIAEISDNRAGMICAWIGYDDDMLLRDDAKIHAYISDLFVHTDYRGHGLASALINAVCEIMKSKGVKRLRVCSKASNSEAMSCYSQTGFAPYETIFEKAL